MKIHFRNLKNNDRSGSRGRKKSESALLRERNNCRPGLRWSGSGTGLPTRDLKIVTFPNILLYLSISRYSTSNRTYDGLFSKLQCYTQTHQNYPRELHVLVSRDVWAPPEPDWALKRPAWSLKMACLPGCSLSPHTVAHKQIFGCIAQKGRLKCECPDTVAEIKVSFQAGQILPFFFLTFDGT